MVSNVKRFDESESKEKWLTQAWLEPRFVVVTALALILSWVGNALEMPAELDVILAFIAYGAGGVFGLKTALESLFHERKLDVDLLMVLAALGAASIGEWHEGAVLLFLFSLSNVLQDYAIGRSRNAIKNLFKLYPEEAKVHRNGEVVVVSIDQIQAGETVLIEPGERIPVDGEIIGGRSSVDQSPITGESMPVEKGVGDTVFAGTLNKQGLLDVKATKSAEQTTLSRIIKMVEEAQDAQAPTERFLDTFEQYYAGFIIFAVILFIIIPPLFLDVDFTSNFYKAMVLMTVASPCALVISVPASFISAIASAARMGVLFKGGAYLEQMAAIKVITFDKTGTLTEGNPAVTDVVSCCEMAQEELLSVAASIEARSEHPLARAIVNEATSRDVPIREIDDFEALAGQGIVATIDGRVVRIGSIGFLRQTNLMPEHLVEIYDKLESEGKTVIGVVRDGQCEGCGECDVAQDNVDWMGVIAMADQLRLEAVEVVHDLQRQGYEIAMLTGDNERVAASIGAQTGIKRVHAALMPDGKVEVIKQLEAEVGPVAMIGDGVNDAPALAVASIGIAMGAAGTDVALETADIVLMGDKLALISEAINLSKKARRVVWQNIIFSLAVIVFLVFSVFIIDLPLPFGVLGHEGSTVIVVLNGLIALLILPEINRRRQGV